VHICKACLCMDTWLFCACVQGSFVQIYTALLGIYIRRVCAWLNGSFVYVYRALMSVYTGLLCKCI